MGIYDQPEEHEVVQLPPPKPQLLVSTGLDEWWSHCAVCGAQPDGNWSDGSVKWTGGVVFGVPHGQLNVFAFACRCASGRELHDRQRMPHFDQVKNVMGATWETQPYPVVSRRSKRPRLPQAEKLEQFRDAAFRQTRRFFNGDLAPEKLVENLEFITNKLAPERQPSPGIDDILFSPELWGVYFPGVPYPERLNPMATHRLSARGGSSV